MVTQVIAFIMVGRGGCVMLLGFSEGAEEEVIDAALAAWGQALGVRFALRYNMRGTLAAAPQVGCRAARAPRTPTPTPAPCAAPPVPQPSKSG